MKTGRSARGFTLAELIMAVALLAVFSIFIVQMFAKADTLARRARTLDQAVACASDFADRWRSDLTYPVPAVILDLWENRVDSRSITISLDPHFQICPPEQAYYEAALTLSALDNIEPDGPAGAAAGELWQLCIVIGRAEPSDSPPLYRLLTSRYFPGGEDDP